MHCGDLRNLKNEHKPTYQHANSFPVFDTYYNAVSPPDLNFLASHHSKASWSALHSTASAHFLFSLKKVGFDLLVSLGGCTSHSQAMKLDTSPTQNFDGTYVIFYFQVNAIKRNIELVTFKNRLNTCVVNNLSFFPWETSGKGQLTGGHASLAMQLCIASRNARSDVFSPRTFSNWP